MRRLHIILCLSIILTVARGNALARDAGPAGSKDSLWRGVHQMTPGKMDEVFLVVSDQCPRCRGKSPAEVFTTAVNDLHAHLVQAACSTAKT